MRCVAASTPITLHMFVDSVANVSKAEAKLSVRGSVDFHLTNLNRNGSAHKRLVDVKMDMDLVVYLTRNDQVVLLLEFAHGAQAAGTVMGALILEQLKVVKVQQMVDEPGMGTEQQAQVQVKEVLAEVCGLYAKAEIASPRLLHHPRSRAARVVFQQLRASQWLCGLYVARVLLVLRVALVER